MAKTIKYDVISLSGEKVGDVALPSDIFGIKEDNHQVIHDAVITHMANSRQATAKTKKRHEVSGGGKKPWRQKGTGRARAGSTRSPIWVGGGKVFGPDGNQNYTVYQNKKAHLLALRTALSQKVKNGLIVIDNLTLDKINSKAMAHNLINIKAEGKTLIVTNDNNVKMSAQNLDKVKVVAPNNVSVYDLLNVKNLVIGKGDIESLAKGA